jgi:bifunctional non-homologous end joining protein LigD
LVHPLARNTLALLPGAKAAPMPQALSPMLALLRPNPPAGEEWVFEPKLDGFRTIAYLEPKRVTLRSRNETDMTGYFPAVASELKVMEIPAILDGEMVAIDERGKTCFQCLQQTVGLPHQHAGGTFSTVYYVFDVVYVNGISLVDVPWEQRREVLGQLVLPGIHVKPIERFEGDGELVFRAAVDTGLEGIVAKKKRSLYESGRRSGSWVKVKSTLSDEFIVGGFARGRGKRADSFGSLLLGYYDGNNLVYAGSVGSGFDEKSLRELKLNMQPLISARSPFTRDIEYSAGVTWLKPVLVAEVRFAEWTPAGMLRVPVFLRVRADKIPSDIRHTAAPISEPFPRGEVIELSGSTRNILEGLQNRDEEVRVRAGGYEISLRGLDKVFWPSYRDRPALTKRDYLTYLAEVADLILPHLKDRPLTLTRYPDGISGEKFYQKHWETAPPEYVRTVSLFSKENKAFQEYLLCNNLPTLLWLGQAADIELHTWYSRVSEKPDPPDLSSYKGSPEHLGNYLSDLPDFLVFDIDPYIYSGSEAAGAEPELNRSAFGAAVETALWLRDALESLRLTAFVKTSGKTGLHVFAPVKRRFDFDTLRRAAATICRHLESLHPEQITTEWAVAKRRGKVFLDFNQNTRGKTVASIYSPRPTAWASVSLPFTWEELAGIYPADFNITNAPARLARVGDLWADILRHKGDFESIVQG